MRMAWQLVCHTLHSCFARHECLRPRRALPGSTAAHRRPHLVLTANKAPLPPLVARRFALLLRLILRGGGRKVGGGQLEVMHQRGDVFSHDLDTELPLRRQLKIEGRLGELHGSDGGGRPLHGVRLTPDIHVAQARVIRVDEQQHPLDNTFARRDELGAHATEETRVAAKLLDGERFVNDRRRRPIGQRLRGGHVRRCGPLAPGDCLVARDDVCHVEEAGVDSLHARAHLCHLVALGSLAEVRDHIDEGVGN
mmetsp:Transcript_12821/g.29249  ORF Transcript_12821/g.29249 Transcript_12821/m.29249 type:complete len:252 (+) Transcript_12821:128-883(+)